MRISDWSSDVCSSDLLDEYLQCREIAGIGDIEMTVVLGMGIEDGVVFPFFLGLVFPVGVHRQAERILPPEIRKRVVSGKSVSVRVALGGRRIIKKNK